MKTNITLIACLLLSPFWLPAQDIIPLDTSTWTFKGKHVIENFRGKRAVYSQGGSITLKDTKFLNGTIEFDLFLKESHAFPGLYFRLADNDGEQFYLRPHQSGNPDATQAAPLIKGITPWQLCFGPRYSFPYDFKYNDWTHVRLVVNGDRAQVFLDGAVAANLSWDLFHEAVEGDIVIRGGGAEAMHIADVKVDPAAVDLVDFAPLERESIEGLIPQWEVSDMFEERLLDDHEHFEDLIKGRVWQGTIDVEEGTAANISRQQLLYNGDPGNTVMAKVIIHSERDQVKLLDFGYSDRVVAILNGAPIYKGTNKWRSRDYRYLGTIGLFDSIYLQLKKGKNELIMTVSEDFGGWLITGRISDMDGIDIE